VPATEVAPEVLAPLPPETSTETSTGTAES
jgi:hypothetical protein